MEVEFPLRHKIIWIALSLKITLYDCNVPKNGMHANPKSYIRRLVEPKGRIVIIHLFRDKFGELGELFRVEGEFLSQQLGSVVKSIHPSQFKRIDHSDLLQCFKEDTIVQGIKQRSRFMRI